MVIQDLVLIIVMVFSHQSSFRWRLSEEFFLKILKASTTLSFRASYGITGEIPRYDYLFYNTYSTYSILISARQPIFPSRMELKNLKWQSLHGANIGANVSLYKGRVRIDAEIYRNRTKDMFFDGLQLSGVTGFSSIFMNVGTMDNQGWEVAIWTQPVKKKDLIIGFDFNISSNENIIREISDLYPNSRGDVNQNGEYLRLLQINNPFGSFYGYKFKGVYSDRDATIARGADGKPIIGTQWANYLYAIRLPFTRLYFSTWRCYV
jgi:hypothetical protein